MPVFMTVALCAALWCLAGTVVYGVKTWRLIRRMKDRAA